jgi:hypothetical protein
MRSLSTSTGTTVSTTRRSRPLCKAHSAPRCSSTTLATITTVRFMPGNEGDGGRDEIIGQHAQAGSAPQHPTQGCGHQHQAAAEQGEAGHAWAPS